MSELNSEIQYLKGVGPKRAELLKKELGINTLQDLLQVYPFRYMDRTTIQRIADINQSSAAIQIKATVREAKIVGEGKGKRLSVKVEDGSGTIEVVFFKGINWNQQKLIPGRSFIFFGKPTRYYDTFNMVHPEVDDVQGSQTDAGGMLTGVYPSTEKLKNAGITNRMICNLMRSALALCLPEIKESLPEYILSEMQLCSLTFALKSIHFPSDGIALEKAQRRLKFEELFLLQLSLLKQKYIRSRQSVGFPMPKVGPDFNACYNALPYKLTGAQQRVIKEIRSDLMSGKQMNRLLQGDVGSGKTMVAVLTSLLAIGNGYQTCLLAPTEVLATQHFTNIQKYLAPTSAKCALLTGSTKQKDRAVIHQGLEDGSISILVGTHALLEDKVRWRNLGLAVIDEQHRFGVDQRAKIWSKNKIAPHVLVMTATPIPRTLAMTVYGDLDVSVIDEMPPGRTPVRTTLHGMNKLPVIYNFMESEIKKGRQVFVVYPMIFENEKMDLQNLERGYEEIMHRFPHPQYTVAMVHGKQSAEEKAKNMNAFADGRAQILVSTTVIEVGVDVPNASVMVIMSSERFGLSQLHQLRGRVGRGAAQSHCVLVRDVKCSKDSLRRLELMCNTENGFEIADEDMKMRGPGDLEGTAQSGLPINLNIASLSKDGILLNDARACATRVLEADPDLSRIENQKLALELRKDKYFKKDYSKIS